MIIRIGESVFVSWSKVTLHKEVLLRIFMVSGLNAGKVFSFLSGIENSSL